MKGCPWYQISTVAITTVRTVYKSVIYLRKTIVHCMPLCLLHGPCTARMKPPTGKIYNISVNITKFRRKLSIFTYIIKPTSSPLVRRNVSPAFRRLLYAWGQVKSRRGSVFYIIHFRSLIVRAVCSINIVSINVYTSSTVLKLFSINQIYLQNVVLLIVR